MFIFNSQRRIRFIGKFVLLVLLGMQVSFAANAGFQFAPQPKQNVAQAVAATPSCHGNANANLDLSRSLCRLHCVTDAQSLAQYDIPLLTDCLEAAPILVLQATPAARQIPSGAWRAAISHDPPIPVRFCSFQI
jgi:hypothetical protein